MSFKHSCFFPHEWWTNALCLVIITLDLSQFPKLEWHRWNLHHEPPLPDCRHPVCTGIFSHSIHGCLPRWVGVQTAQQGFSWRISQGIPSPLDCCVWTWSVIRLYLTLLFLKTEDKWRDSETLYHACFYFYGTQSQFCLPFQRKNKKVPGKGRVLRSCGKWVLKTFC